MYYKKCYKCQIGKGGRTNKLMQTGDGKFGNWLKNIGKKVFGSFSRVSKNLAPSLANIAGNTALQYASKKGVSDDLVNLGSMINQGMTREVARRTKTDTPLNSAEKVTSNLIQKRLANLMSGQGVRGFGVRTLGCGVRGMGVRGMGIEDIDA